MVRVLIITQNPPWSPGGVEKVVKETALLMNKTTGINMEIWCTGLKNDSLAWNKIKVKIFKSLFGISPALVRELKKRQGEFDVIHIHGTSNLFPIEALLAIEDWNKVIVSSHYHPQGSTTLFKLTKPFYDKLMVSEYLWKAGKVICVSKTEKKILMNRFKLPRDKIKVIYNGVPIDRIKEFKSKREQKQDEVSLLYFGRVERYKNVHVVIESLKYLPDAFVLYIVGKGPYEKRLRKLVKKLGLEGRVKFLGFLPEEGLYSMLHSVDVVVNLSEIEAFGIMVIESLAAGKPVVVNNKLGLKELAEHFPWAVIPVENPNPEKVAKIIKERALNKKVKIRGLRRFNWDRIAKLYSDFYKKTGGKQNEIH